MSPEFPEQMDTCHHSLRRVAPVRVNILLAEVGPHPFGSLPPWLHADQCVDEPHFCYGEDTRQEPTGLHGGPQDDESGKDTGYRVSDALDRRVTEE